MMIEWELKWNIDIGYIVDDKCIIGGISEAKVIRQQQGATICIKDRGAWFKSYLFRIYTILIYEIQDFYTMI
jgi:hypothetical protein